MLGVPAVRVRPPAAAASAQPCRRRFLTLWQLPQASPQVRCVRLPVQGQRLLVPLPEPGRPMVLVDGADPALQVSLLHAGGGLDTIVDHRGTGVQA